MRRALLFGLLAAGVGFTQLGPPRLGFVRDASGSLRAVIGVAGNFVLGSDLLGDLRSVGFSGRIGIATTDAELLVFDTRGQTVHQREIQGGEAHFAFDRGGRAALACVISTGDLFRWPSPDRWKSPTMQRAAWSCRDVDGELLGLGQPRPGVVSMAVRRGDSVWMVHRRWEDGLVRFETMLPGVSEPLFIDPAGTVVYVDASELVVRRIDGSEQRLPRPFAVEAFEWMGGGWIRVRAASDGPGAALRLDGEAPKLYRLPGGSP